MLAFARPSELHEPPMVTDPLAAQPSVAVQVSDSSMSPPPVAAICTSRGQGVPSPAHISRSMVAWRAEIDRVIDPLCQNVLWPARSIDA
jgi:hypothetical protein